MIHVPEPISISPGMRAFHSQYCTNATYLTEGFKKQPESNTPGKVVQLIAIEEEQSTPKITVLLRLASRYFRLAGNEVKDAYSTPKVVKRKATGPKVSAPAEDQSWLN